MRRVTKARAGRNGEVLVPVPKDLAKLVGLKPGDAVILTGNRGLPLIVSPGDEPPRVS